MKILAILVAVVALAPAAHAQTTDRTARIATGEPGKTYHNVYGVSFAAASAEETGGTLDYALPDGTRVYQLEKVRTTGGVFGSGMFAKRLDTICTSAMLFARSDANPNLLRKLADLVSLQREELVTNPIADTHR